MVDETPRALLMQAIHLLHHAEQNLDTTQAMEDVYAAFVVLQKCVSSSRTVAA